MSRLLKPPKIEIPPAPEPPPPAPTIDEASRVRAEQDKIRRRKGRAATLFTGETGAGSPTSVAVKTLTGE